MAGKGYARSDQTTMQNRTIKRTSEPPPDPASQDTANTAQ